MTSYRFCRPDDMQLLINAINRCVRVHDPSLPVMDTDEYKNLVRTKKLWASSCMIAFEGSEKDIVSVIIGAKHEKETHILMMGNHPEHMSRGHVTHMLESLQSKLAILGPPKLVVDVPEGNTRASVIFERLGYSVVDRQNGSVSYSRQAA